MSEFEFKLARLLEVWSIELKEHANQKLQDKFLNTYGLKDIPQQPRKVTKYNYYGCVNVRMLEELLKADLINREDVILDVGCGTGIFLIYMAANGFKHLIGQDLDPDLLAIARRNKKAFLKKSPEYQGNIELRLENAVTTNFPDDVNVCYLFNSFYDQQTYEEWLMNVEQSLKRNPRHLTIVLLYPTPASMGAFRKNGAWLKETQIIESATQVCSYCVRFQVFENNVINTGSCRL